MKQKYLHDTTALSPSPILPREAYRCSVTNDEIEALGPNPTWDDWRALFLSKEIPTSRLNAGTDFRMNEHKNGDIETEFP